MNLSLSHIKKYLDFYPSVDFLTSRVKCPNSSIFPYRPDQKAEVINAFCISWHNLPFYCFHQFLLIRKLLQKIISGNVIDILFVPNWPSHF